MEKSIMDDLETLMATEDIRRVEARYARYADHKRWKDLAGLFAEDGWFRSIDVEGNEIVNKTGRDDIAKSLGSRNSRDVQPIHQLLTHEIDIESPTTAKAVWAMADLIFRGDSAVGEPGPDDILPPHPRSRTRRQDCGEPDWTGVTSPVPATTLDTDEHSTDLEGRRNQAPAGGRRGPPHA